MVIGPLADAARFDARERDEWRSIFTACLPDTRQCQIL